MSMSMPSKNLKSISFKAYYDGLLHWQVSSLEYLSWIVLHRSKELSFQRVTQGLGEGISPRDLAYGFPGPHSSCGATPAPSQPLS